MEDTSNDSPPFLSWKHFSFIAYDLFNPLISTAAKLTSVVNNTSINQTNVSNQTDSILPTINQLNGDENNKTPNNSFNTPTPVAEITSNLTPNQSLLPPTLLDNSPGTIPKKTHVTGSIKDHNNQAVTTDIKVVNSNEQTLVAQTARYDFNFELYSGDNIIFNAGAKQVSARFNIRDNSTNSTITLDNFGNNIPESTSAPHFKSMKFIEVHTEDIDYESVTIIISYSDEDLAGFNEDQLMVYHYTGGQWKPTKSYVNKVSNTITITVNSLSYFAIGQGSGINVYARSDRIVNPDDTVTVSGGIYYDNLTVVPGAVVTVNIDPAGINTSTTTDSFGNFRVVLSPPSSGIYTIQIEATKASLNASDILNLEVNNEYLFRMDGNILQSNEDVVASTANISITSELPIFSVPDNSHIVLIGKTSITGTKIYNLFTDMNVDSGINATGTYNFVVDSLTSGEVTKNWAKIYLYAVSYTGLSVAEDTYETYLDGTYIVTSPYIKPWDQATWYWNHSIPVGDIRYNQIQIVNIVTPNPSTQVRFNLTGNMDINFSSTDLNIPSNSQLYVDNLLLLSTTGNLGSEDVNITGFLNDTNQLDITSDMKGGVSFSLDTQFHGYVPASVVEDGENFTVTLSVTNNGRSDWSAPVFSYTVPLGAKDFVVIDQDNSDLNVTSFCTLPSNGGEVIIPASVVRKISSGITRTFTLSYSLKQLEITTTSSRSTYMPGQDVQVFTNVLYNSTPVTDASVTVTIKDPLDVAIFNGPAAWNGNNYSITRITDETWPIGVYHVTVNASKTVDDIARTGTNITSFVEKRLIMYMQANGPYPPRRNITITGRAYYSDESAEGGKTVNISVGTFNTTAITNTTGHFQTSIPGMSAGSYPVIANITNGYGLTDSDTDTLLVLSTPFFILIDTDLSETSGQALLEPNHTFNVEVPTGMDVLSSTITLTGITQKTEEYDISPPPISMLNIGTTQFNFMNGTFTVIVPPYRSVTLNDVSMTVTAFPQGTGVQESVFNNSIDGIDVGESRYVVPDTPSTQSWTDDITARVTPGSVHDVRITKLDTFTIDYRFLVMMHVNRTGFLDTPLNPRAYVVGNIIYAQPGDMLTSSHTTDITKFLEAGSNSVNFVNDRNALVNYIIQTRVRDWNFTQETVVEIPNTFEIENVLFAAATDQKLMNPEIRHPLKKYASNLTVFDIDNN
ncbi:MAG: carboxypeptidase-like regulatory domain-containing protein, partial [Methanosarcinales archaeon]|nr:carboxypeptidase-like regulatory domain-containing protein [Methanosarcinales archaeon]